MLDRNNLLLIVVMFCVLNGMFSPFLVITMTVSAAWLPELVSGSINILFFLSSILLSTLTLMLSGIPAALYERFMRLETSDTASMLIWMAGAALLTIPAITNLV